MSCPNCHTPFPGETLNFFELLDHGADFPITCPVCGVTNIWNDWFREALSKLNQDYDQWIVS